MAQDTPMPKEIGQLRTELADLQQANRVARDITEQATARAEAAERARKFTQEWYASHYGKLQDWARKRLPEPWVTEFFNCVANGTWGDDDRGKPYMCAGGFEVVPGGYFRTDTAEGQMVLDQTRRAEDAEQDAASVRETLYAVQGQAAKMRWALEAVQRWAREYDFMSFSLVQQISEAMEGSK